jgi:UDP-glucose 4-epimerase
VRVLVTGGAGYIGSICSAILAEQGFDVTVVDNLSAGHRAAVKHADFVRCDLLDEKKLGEILAAKKVEAVLHFAASCLVGESVRDPEKYYRNNVLGTIHLLSAMRSRDVKKIIFSSSAAVYGIPETKLITEDHPEGPINPYGRTKLDCEHMLEYYRSAYSLGYVSLRYFNAAGAAYGLGEDHEPETHLIPSVLHAALGKRDAITIFGTDYPTRDGTCIRDYVHVADLSRAHVLALQTLDEGTGCFYNLGNGKGFSVKDVIETAERVVGRTIPRQSAPPRAGDPPTLVASSEKITTELGWQPEFASLEQIMESAWQWHRRHPDGYGD